MPQSFDLNERERDIPKGDAIRYISREIFEALGEIEEGGKIRNREKLPIKDFLYLKGPERRVELNLEIHRNSKIEHFDSFSVFDNIEEISTPYKRSKVKFVFIHPDRESGGKFIWDKRSDNAGNIEIYRPIWDFGKIILQNKDFLNIDKWIISQAGIVSDKNEYNRIDATNLIEDIKEEVESNSICSLLASYLLQYKEKWKQTLFHEIEHYLDRIEFMDRKKYKDAHKDYPEEKETEEDWRKYFNHPIELEAYFRGAVEEFMNNMHSGGDLSHEFYELVKEFRKENPDTEKTNTYIKGFMNEFILNYLNKSFWNYLSEENQKRMKKRFYTFLQEQIKDVLIKN